MSEQRQDGWQAQAERSREALRALEQENAALREKRDYLRNEVERLEQENAALRAAMRRRSRPYPAGSWVGAVTVANRISDSALAPSSPPAAPKSQDGVVCWCGAKDHRAQVCEHPSKTDDWED